MRRSRFSEEQITGILREAAAGAKTEDICRRHGISKDTFYRWRKKYGEMEADDVRRLKQLEEENLRLKRRYCQLVGTGAALGKQETGGSQAIVAAFHSLKDRSRNRR